MNMVIIHTELKNGIGIVKNYKYSFMNFFKFYKSVVKFRNALNINLKV